MFIVDRLLGAVPGEPQPGRGLFGKDAVAVSSAAGGEAKNDSRLHQTGPPLRPARGRTAPDHHSAGDETR